MKTIYTLLFILTIGLTQGQTIYGDCNAPTEIIEINGGLTLNGETLYLYNAILKVRGNINGYGEIRFYCGSQICITGQDNSNGQIAYRGADPVRCNTLSEPIFSQIENTDLEFEIYDTLGRLERHGRTSANMYDGLTSGLKAVVVKGYKPFKHIVQ